MIQIQVRNKVAVNLTPEEFIVCGNNDYDVEFLFDEEWGTEIVKTARFVYHKDGRNYFNDVVFTGNTVKAPVLSDINCVLVGAYAGELITTTPALVACEKSILCGFGEHEDPTPDVYNQLIELINAGGSNIDLDVSLTQRGAAAEAKAVGDALENKAQKDHKHTTSEIEDFPESMPASDVYEWAKKPTKPSYTADEVSARPNTWTPTASEVGAAPADHVKKTFFTIPKDETAIINFSGTTNAMIYCRAWTSGVSAVISYSGYAGGDNRQNLSVLSNGGQVSCVVLPESKGQGLAIKCSRADTTIDVCIDGELQNNPPTVTFTTEAIAGLSNAVSFAPSGYGLGADIASTIDLDTVTKSGNYKGPIRLPGMSVDVTVWCRADMSSPNYGTQHLYSELNGGLEFYRTKSNGVWGELECVNPPMTPGVEYRTTERWNGKVVYTKAFECQALPNKTHIGFGITDLDVIVSVTGYTVDNSTGYKYHLPTYGYTDGLLTMTPMHHHGSTFYIKTYVDASGWSAYFQVKYTKK